MEFGECEASEKRFPLKSLLNPVATHGCLCKVLVDNKMTMRCKHLVFFLLYPTNIIFVIIGLFILIDIISHLFAL